MACPRSLLVTVATFLAIECTSSLQLLELRVPTAVARGASAALACRWKLGAGDVLYSVKWYKDGKEFFHHVPRDPEPRRSFPLPGVYVERSDPSGSNVTLGPAEAATGGRYRCEVSGERPLFPTVSDHADMTVVVKTRGKFVSVPDDIGPRMFLNILPGIPWGKLQGKYDMIIFVNFVKTFPVLPASGPTLTGLRSRYRAGERVQVKCAAGASSPPARLAWYINGEPAPPAALTLATHHDQQGLGTTMLALDFRLTEEHFINNGFKVKCLATVATLYWRSNEESAVRARSKSYDTMVLRTLTTASRAAEVGSDERDAANTTHLKLSSIITTAMVILACFVFK